MIGLGLGETFKEHSQVRFLCFTSSLDCQDTCYFTHKELHELNAHQFEKPEMSVLNLNIILPIEKKKSCILQVISEIKMYDLVDKVNIVFSSY